MADQNNELPPDGKTISVDLAQFARLQSPNPDGRYNLERRANYVHRLAASVGNHLSYVRDFESNGTMLPQLALDKDLPDARVYLLRPFPGDPAVPPIYRDSMWQLTQFPELYYDISPWSSAWSPPGGLDQGTFEEYVVTCLNHPPGSFQMSLEWLKWVLTQTSNKDLVALINMVLFCQHGCKARHAGDGMIETVGVAQHFYILQNMVHVDAMFDFTVPDWVQ
ncbi:hypothetical protein F5Y18DRAFT_424294 [Xylariaceae sp. FL1019]|nr:hypothetical protein F5Y18DRAFT_424294 [Xylariaceae sp. FL1019]